MKTISASILVRVLAAVSLTFASQPTFISTAVNGDLVFSTQVNSTVLLNEIDLAGQLQSARDEQAQLEALVSARQKEIDDLSVAVADSASRICIVGGSKSERLSTVVRLDGSKTETLLSMKWPREDHKAVSYLGKIYAIGGSSDLTSVEVFDGFTWADAASLPTARQAFAAAVYRDHIYVIGGGTGSDFDSVDRFNGSAWSASAPLPEARILHAAVVYRDRIHVIAGTQYATALKSVQVFDGVSWTRGHDVLTTRISHTAVVYRDRIYIAGGLASFTLGLIVSTVEMFDGSTWTQAPALSEGRHGHSSVVFRDNIYMLGGFQQEESGHVSTTSVEVYDGVSWREGLPLTTAVAKHAAIVHVF